MIHLASFGIDAGLGVLLTYLVHSTAWVAAAPLLTRTPPLVISGGSAGGLARSAGRAVRVEPSRARPVPWLAMVAHRAEPRRRGVGSGAAPGRAGAAGQRAR